MLLMSVEYRDNPRTCSAGVACALLAALFAAPHAARAQFQVTDQGPVFGAQVKRPFFNIDAWSGELTLEYLKTTQDNKSPQVREKADEDLFTESLTLSTHGSIIHPNLIEFDASGTLDLRQRDFTATSTITGDLASRGDDVSGQFDLNATILRNQVTSYTLIAQRAETTVNRDFGPTLIQTTQTYAAGVDVKAKTFPMRAQIAHTETSLDDPAGLQGFNSSQDSFVYGVQWNIAPNSHLSANYTYYNTDQKADLGLPVKFETNELNLFHTYTFGENQKNALLSSLNYFNQSGDFATDRLRFEERLDLQHSDTFQTYYRYDFTQDSRDAFDQTTHDLEAGFRHQLYKSLFTTGSLGYTFQDVSGVEKTNELYARLEFDYTKKVPLGTLGLNLSLNYDYRTSDSQGGTLQFINQPFAFSEPLGIEIVQQNINPNSIVVKDASGSRVYIPGIDYIVVSAPDRTEIRRVIGGAIPPSANVLVDYNVASLPSNDQSTYGYGLGGSYLFERGPLKGLLLYARYFSQDQSISAEQADQFIPESIRDTVVGARYRRGPFTVGAEQQWHASELAPFDSTRFDASYSQAVLRDAFITLSADYNILDYKDINDRVEYLNLTASLDYQLGLHWHIIGTAAYRDQKDSLFGDTTGYEEQLQLVWQQRQTTVNFVVRNVNLESDTQDSNYQAFQIVIRRSF
jgi:hypothetical protein